MKKWLVGCVGCAILLNINFFPAFAEERTSKTEVSVTFVQHISPGELPGIEVKASIPASLLIAKHADFKTLPKTNEQVPLITPLLGFIFAGYSWSLWQFRNRKDVN